MLIASRALLGIAGATLTPSTLSLITNLFRDPRQRASAVAVWAGCFVVGAIIGPIVGGLLLEQFWWGSVFLLGVPAMVLLLVAGPVLLPEHRNPQAGPLVALGTNLVVSSAPPPEAGSAASVAQTANELDYALGIATLGSIGTAVYRAQLADAIPTDIPAQAAKPDPSWRS
jgi:MFS transporter, DHA2 family, multidrug resistance protein